MILNRKQLSQSITPSFTHKHIYLSVLAAGELRLWHVAAASPVVVGDAARRSTRWQQPTEPVPTAGRHRRCRRPERHVRPESAGGSCGQLQESVRWPAAATERRHDAFVSHVCRQRSEAAGAWQWTQSVP